MISYLHPYIESTLLGIGFATEQSFGVMSSPDKVCQAPRAATSREPAFKYAVFKEDIDMASRPGRLTAHLGLAPASRKEG
jgi:hypothetical protein